MTDMEPILALLGYAAWNSSHYYIRGNHNVVKDEQSADPDKKQILFSSYDNRLPTQGLVQTMKQVLAKYRGM